MFAMIRVLCFIVNHHICGLLTLSLDQLLQRMRIRHINIVIK